MRVYGVRKLTPRFQFQLASLALLNSPQDDSRRADFAIVDRVTEVAKKRGLNNAQIALAWVLHQPGITAPIIGASKPHHLEDAVKALSVKLDADELKYLSELYKPRTVLANM